MTVVFHLTRPEAPFIANMAMDFASIVSKEYADAMLEAGTPEMLNQAPIGTGPFIFQAYQKDAVIRYLRNDDYWDDPAAVEALIFAITPGRLGALPEGAGGRVPRDGLSEPGRCRRR